ncbi:MAG: PHP domain-containing protein [Ignavibacteriaceae bacterium]
MNEYVGAMHMHSTYSDGSGKVEDIAKDANEVGLDFIILTDHNTLRALKEGYEGWYGNTFLLVGCEINDKENRNHYLAFGIENTFSTRISAKEYVKKVKDSGGIGFLAHPHEKRAHMKEHPPYPWTEWNTDDFTGIEIWNHMSEWMENLTEQNKYQSFLHPLKSIISPPKETLKLWDELNQKRKVVGVGGVDAHAHKYNIFGLLEVEIFPYKVLFKSIRTHILTEEQLQKGKSNKSLLHNKKVIYNSLKEGRCFIANDYHASSIGFSFTAVSGKKTFFSGDEIKKNGEIFLKVSIPPFPKTEIRLIHNGKRIKAFDSQTSEFKVNEKGVYRIEVYLNKKAWIFSNHIRIV